MPFTQAMREVAEKAIGEDPESSPQPSEAPSSSLDQPSEQEAVKEGESPQPESGQSSSDLTAYEKQLIADVGGFDDLDETGKKLFLAKVKAYDKLSHRSAQEAAEYRRLRDTLSSVPGLADKVKDLIERGARGEITPQQAQKELEQSPTLKSSLRGFDKYIAKAESADDRETLRDLRQTILEEVGVLVESETSKLKKDLEGFRATARTQSAPSMHKEIDSLEEDGLPAAIVEKYRDQLISAKQRYPSASMFKLLVTLADDDETRTLMTPRKETKRPATIPASVAASPKKPSAQEHKRKDGTWNIGGWLRSAVPAE